jgi:hypothetical protein
MNKLILSCFFAAFLGVTAFTQTFYDRATIQTIEIFFGFANWDAQLDALATTTEDYLIADSVRVNGVMYDSVGVKYKGNSSYNPNNNKNPLHIDLNHVNGGADYQGYTNIKLSNGYGDPSMIREVLSYAILEQYMDCPKANFANVYINGTLRGIYSSAESINDAFNGDHYYTTEGAFFKCNPLSGAGPGITSSPDLNYLGTDSVSYASSYEIKSSHGWKEFIAMMDTLNNNFSEIESVLDVDRALWMLAFNNVLVNLDSYSGAFRQNYFMYRDLNGRFVPTIWDLNMSFAGFPGGTGGGAYTATTLDPMSNSTSANHPLIVKLLGDPLYKRMYMAHIRTILQEVFISGNYLTIANSLRTTINASVQSDPYKFYTYAQYQNSLTTAVTGGGGPGGGTSIPGIQALMSARSTYFSTNANYILVAPTIPSINFSSSTPTYGQTITVNATCTNETTVFLGYRFDHPLKFTRVQMFDDGAHNDGAAGDHVYGVDVVLNGLMMEYYVYAENANAGLFSPQRAEHEFHTLMVSLPIATAGQVVINEVMASNSLTAFDNFGESDDWIELYNTTSTPLSISGLFLSDDPLYLNRWQFPSGTFIDANDYLIIWADDDTSQYGLHTNFKLSSNGETLVLSDGTAFFDDVTFGIQTTDVSYARCPDAGVFSFAPPTFSAPNNCTVSLSELDQPLAVSVYPVPTLDVVFITSQEEQLTLMVVDLSGRQLFATKMSAGKLEIPSATWMSGYYRILLTNEITGKSTSIPMLKQ